jgi:hypothetical protein
LAKKASTRQRRLQRQLNGYRADEDALLALDGADELTVLTQLPMLLNGTSKAFSLPDLESVASAPS